MLRSPTWPFSGCDAGNFCHEVRYTDRPIPRISLRHFEARIDTITADVCAAAERHGFFALIDHPIPQAVIDAQFAAAERFFALSDAVEARTRGCAQARTARAAAAGDDDNDDDDAHKKEEYLVHFGDAQQAADTDLPGFHEQNRAFMRACHSLSARLMVCLARGLGCTEDNAQDDHVFVHAHSPAQPETQTALHLQRYAATEPPPTGPARSTRSTRSARSARSARSPCALHSPCSPRLPRSPRSPSSRSSTRSASTSGSRHAPHQPRPAYRGGGARAVSDNAFLTLRFFQRPGQGGLEICGSRKTVTDCSMDDEDEWTEVEPAAGEIVCNVGDLLMLWSDDRYKSALYRVRAPADPAVDDFGDCYRLAYANLPSRACVIQGPLRTFPPITAGEFLDLARAYNVAALEERRQKKALDETIAATSSAAAAAASHVHHDAGATTLAVGASMASYIPFL